MDEQQVDFKLLVIFLYLIGIDGEISEVDANRVPQIIN